MNNRTLAGLGLLAGVIAGLVFTPLGAHAVIAAKDTIRFAGGSVTGTELLKSAGVTAGTVTANKALVVGAFKSLDTLGVTTLTSTTCTIVNLKLGTGPTVVTADATEVNTLDGVTAAAAELNYLDLTTVGTTQATKTLVVDSNKRLDTLVLGTLYLGSGAGTAVTADAGELSILNGVTAISTEVNNAADDAIASVFTSATAGPAYVNVDFIFQDAAAANVSAATRCIEVFHCNAAGELDTTATDSITASTGAILAMVTDKVYIVTTSGPNLSLVLTSGVGHAARRLGFRINNNKALVSGALDPT